MYTRGLVASAYWLTTRSAADPCRLCPCRPPLRRIRLLRGADGACIGLKGLTPRCIYKVIAWFLSTSEVTNPSIQGLATGTPVHLDRICRHKITLLYSMLIRSADREQRYQAGVPRAASALLKAPGPATSQDSPAAMATLQPRPRRGCSLLRQQGGLCMPTATLHSLVYICMVLHASGWNSDSVHSVQLAATWLVLT